MTSEVNSKSTVDISIKNKGCASSEMKRKRWSHALEKCGRPQFLLGMWDPMQDTSSLDGERFIALRQRPGVRYPLGSFPDFIFYDARDS